MVTLVRSNDCGRCAGASVKRLTMVLSIGLLVSFGVFAQQGPEGQPDRIVGRLDPSHLAAIRGNVHPRARPESDRGRVSPDLELDYITLHLTPTSAQQAELNRFLAELQDPASANYRKWLTPEQYADRFGSSPSDLAQITAWLEGQGLTVISTARGRNFVTFKGAAGRVEAALHTEIHHFLVDGEMHYANVTAPSVPASILPFTIGFEGLDDFKWKPPAHAVQPVANYNTGTGHTLAPGDLWVIYNILPLLSAGVNGSGMSLAVIGQSDVNLSDIAAFRTAFGLAANVPVKMLVTGATNPGIVTGDSGESDLDLEWSAAIAPLAQVVFVFSKSVTISVEYAIDSALAPVISYSYAACEPLELSSGASIFEALAQQANAEGITWLASSGDQGAAACDGGNTVAAKGIAVNLPASVPEVTGVGGTTFSESVGGNYWLSSIQAFGDSALSYIPEVAWNDTAIANQLSASGGGMSIYFPRPTWQSGPGVPGINVRLVPDVSLAASPNHDGYNVIENGGPLIIGGTSVSTPVFAGIVLLMNQYLGTNGLGNINPGLYKLASTVPNIFHDIQSGTNFVPCIAGTTGCLNGTLGYSAGPGYDMVTGLGSVNANNLILASKAANQPVLTQIINGATIVDSGLSPGLIFAVKGSGLGPSIPQSLELNTNGYISTTLSGVQVLVNGTPAPIYYASATQINAIAPYEIANMAGQRVNVQVVNNGVSSANLSDLVVATAPGMFNLGNNQAAVVNQDGTVNGPGNPAARGSYVLIYGTGEGQTTPPGIDGFVPTSAANVSRPNAQVSVFMNQLTAQILYAGTASFDGFFQINAVVPQGLVPGPVPITVTVGGVASPTLTFYVK